MIKRGELATETEQHGLRHTVWVLMDDVVEDTNEDSTGNTNGHLPASSEHTGGDTGAENLALQTEVKGLRELVDLYRERLTDADWRYQELLEQFKTMTKALPAAQDAAPPTEPLVVALPVTPGHHNQDTAHVAASIGCSLFLAGFLFPKPSIPEAREHLFSRFRTLTRRPPSVDSGLSRL